MLCWSPQAISRQGDKCSDEDRQRSCGRTKHSQVQKRMLGSTSLRRWLDFDCDPFHPRGTRELWGGKVFTCHCFYCAPYLLSECFKVQALELNVFSPNLCCCSVTMSCPTLCHWMDCSMPGFPVFSISRSLLKLMCTESVMPSNHLILCYHLLLLPLVFPSITVFSNK